MKNTDWLRVALTALIIYTAASSGCYRFRHPEMTETQLILKAGDWLRWKR